MHKIKTVGLVVDIKLAARAFLEIGQWRENRNLVQIRWQAFVFGQTSSMFDAQVQQQSFVIDFRALNRKLRNKGSFMFDIHFQIVCFEKTCLV